jgi:hypothetical protein
MVGGLCQELTSVPPVRTNLQYISDIVIALNHQPILSPDMYRILIVGQPAVEDTQVRQTLGSLLIAHATSLNGLETEVRGLGNSKNSDDQRLSVQLLMTMGAKLSESTIEDALNQPEGLQPEAVKYLGTRAEPLSQYDFKILIPILAKPLSAFIWQAAYTTLSKKNPDVIKTFFTQYKQQFEEWAKLPPKTLVPILQSLPDDQSIELASWPLITSEEDDCDILMANLLLVRRRAQAKADFSEGLWTALQGKPTCSESSDPSVLDLINEIFSSRPGLTDEFAHFLSNRTQNSNWDNFISGVAFQTGWEANYAFGASGSNPLQQALSPALAKLLAARQEDKVLELLRLGVPYTYATDIVGSADFTAHYKNRATLGKESVLEMLGRLPHFAKDLSDEILLIAKDNTKSTTVRQAAIIALANSDNAQAYFSDFVNIAQEPINLPSAAAIRALVRLYASPGPNLPDLPPTAPWLETAAADQLTRQDTSRLLELLAIRNQAFGPLLLRSIDDVTSYRCWDLAALNTVQPRLWLAILDAGLANSDRLNPARACVMILTANQPAAALISAALTGQRSQNTPTTSSDRVALLSKHRA